MAEPRSYDRDTSKKTIHVDFHFYDREPPLCPVGTLPRYRTIDHFRWEGLCRSYPNVFSGGNKRHRTNTESASELARESIPGINGTDIYIDSVLL